ncbi:Uncharacterised protein [Mycobacteroides abscessus subsp. abscessus]|nr:Uncharacterised protein [Mycobacteroides abscessus subsp. abscessus]
MISARVFTTDENGELQALTLDDVVAMTGHIRKAHRALYARLAETEPEQRNLYATEMYSWKLKAWARIAGCYGDIDWSISPSIVESYERFSDPDTALALIGGIFVPAERDSCFRPIGQ